MNSPAPLPVYSVDTNSLMEWQARNFPTDVFPGLINRIETLVGAGRFLAPGIVEEEVASVGTAELIQWTVNHGGMFVPTAEVLPGALKIQGQFAGLLDPKAEHEEADAYVIALAQLRHATVVTQETSAAEKRNPKRTHFIPDVCRELGISCINLLGLMRREGWKF